MSEHHVDGTPASGELPPETPVATADSQPMVPIPESTPAPTEPADAAPAIGTPAPLAPAAWGTKAPARKRGGLWIAIALIAIFVLALVGGGGAYVANASLSRTYSPQREVLNYFAAQQRGDVNAMWSNAVFLRGDAAYEQFFSKSALTAMMSLTENKDIRDVTVNSTRVVDPNTAVVSTSMTWSGVFHSYDYTVRKNVADTHYAFYNTWKIDIPNTVINFSLPNQSGDITIDDLPMPVGYSGQPVPAIAGFHTIRMAQTPFFDAVTEKVSAIDISPTVGFAAKISDAARTAAAAAIKAAEGTFCDVSRYTDCPGHTYHSAGAAFTIYFLTGLPGYSEIDYNYYVFNFAGDLTSGMTLSVPKERDLLVANGNCTETMTVNGNRTYTWTGVWAADLAWTGGAFKANFFPDCIKNKA